MIQPFIWIFTSLLLLRRGRKNPQPQPPRPSDAEAQHAAEAAFDREFERSGDEDVAAGVAIKAYQQAGGKDPIFVAQIQYWTGAA